MALEKIGVEATIEGLSSFRRGIGQMEGDVRGFGRTSDGIVPGLNRMGDSLLKIGGIAAGALVAGLAAATAGVVAFTGSGIKAAIDMQDQLGNIAAVMNTTKEAIAPLKDLIIDLGINPNLQVNATEAANAIELLARNGLSMTEIIDGAAYSTVLLANATGAEFGNAADIATDAMAIFNIEAKDMASAVDGIVAVTSNSKFTIDDYSLALRNGGAAAAIMNVSMEDFNTVIAASAEEMGSGMRAGTGFRNFLTRLTPNSEKAAEAMRELGLVTSNGTNMFFDANGQLKDMAEVSGILEQALFGTSTAIVEVGGRTAEQNEELARLQGIYNRTLISIQDYETGVKGAGLSEEARANKLADLQLQLANTAAVMGPLNAIQGDFIETTNQLTDAERSAALELIFGQDALGTAIALANEGEVVYTDLATAMAETGLSQDALSQAMQDGVITSFELLAAQMGQVSAEEQARERMDDLAGVMEVIGGIIEAVQLQIGDAFLPLLQDLAIQFMKYVEDIGPKVVKVFENIAGGFSNFFGNLSEGMSPLNAFTGLLSDLGIPGDVIDTFFDFAIRIEEIVETISEFVSTHAEEFKGALKGIAAVLGGSVIVSVLSSIAGLIGAIISPIGLLIGAAAALGVAIQKNFGGIRDFIDKVWKGIQKSFEGFQKLFAGDFKGFGKDIGEAWEGVWDAVVEFAGNLWSMIQPKLQQLYNSILSWVQSVDWRSVGLSILTFIVNGLSNIGSFLATTIQGWGTQIQGLIQSVDWLSVGMELVTKFLEGMSNLGDRFATWRDGFYISVTNAINSIDWTAVGTNVITFIGNAIVAAVTGIVGFIGVTVTALFNFFSNASQSQDWRGIGTNLLTAIFNALSGFASGVIPVLQGWYQAFISWVQSVDWLAVGTSIVNFVITGLNNFATFIGDTLAGWWNTFTTWVDSIDWVQIGLNIVMFIVEGLVNFATVAAETLAGWWNTFTAWVKSIDWYQIGYDIVTFIIDAFQFFNEEVPKTFTEWTQNFIDWIVETDWQQMAIDLIVDMVVGLAKFWAYAQPKVQGWWDSIKAWFDSIDWGALAQAIIDGLVAGIANGAAAIANAFAEMIQGGIEAAKAAAGIESPSKVFAALGVNLGEGLIIGINSTQAGVQAAMAALFDIGGALGGVGSGFANQLKNDVLPKMEEAIAQNQQTFDVLKNQFAGKFGSIFGLATGEDVTQQKLIDAYFTAVHTGNKQMENDILTIWNVQNQLGAATAEYEQAQASIVALQKAQADLAFLEQQQKLLDLITENGLNAKDILGGLELGLGADTQGLVEAMTRAIQAIIEQANDQLQIASPSGVFKQIGKYITTGLAQGINQTATSPAQAMESMLNSMVQPMQSQAALPSVINQPSTTTITKSAQVDMSGMQVGNEMDLQFLGDFILQKVSEAI